MSPDLRAPAQSPRKPRDRNAEGRIQAAIVEWARAVAPGVVVYAVPNGGLRSKSEAARMKWQGVLAGVPDLAVVCDGRAFFIEVKADDGVLTRSQKETIPLLLEAGARVKIARSIEDARAAFSAWGIATREAST